MRGSHLKDIKNLKYPVKDLFLTFKVLRSLCHLIRKVCFYAFLHITANFFNPSLVRKCLLCSPKSFIKWH